MVDNYGFALSQNEQVSVNNGLHFDFSSDLRLTISALLEKNTASYDQETEPRLITDIAKEILLKKLSPYKNLLWSLLSFSNCSYPSYILLHNFIELEWLPPTPVDDSIPDKKSWRVAASAMLGALSLTGHRAATFQEEMGGRLTHMIMPARNTLESYLRSTKSLNLHTDVVNGLFSEELTGIGRLYSPEVLCLFCLRNFNRTPTTILPLEAVINHLSSSTLEILKKPIFTTSSQASFSRDIITANIPIIKLIAKGYFGIRYSASKVRGITQEAQNALVELRKVLINNPRVEKIFLQPGDLLLMNNRSSLHGRDSLTDTSSFVGTDRWLLRMYGYSDHSLSKVCTNNIYPHIISVD